MSELNPTATDAPPPRPKRTLTRSTLPRNLKGLRIGKLTILGPAPWAAGHHAHWYYRCDCGTEKAVSDIRLRYGKDVNSCGCLQRAVAGAMKKTHGRSGTPEHRSWQAMKCRCLYPSQPQYHYYGGRGIRICSRWLDSFGNFFADIGPMPGPGYSIERKDSDGNYSCGHCEECRANGWPANCRWATLMEQAANKRRNFRITHDGRTLSLGEWSEELRIPYGTLYSYIIRGRTIGQIISSPPRSRRPSSVPRGST